MNRTFNFAAGPAAMPLEVLETAGRELVCYGGTGMSVMEMSHRSKMYTDIYDEAIGLIRGLMNIPDNYSVMMLHGGATAQFSAVPMNLMTGSGRADYIDSGNFAHGAMVEAAKYGQVRCVASSREANYTRVPAWDESNFDAQADYFYLCTNNTIFGTRFTELPATGNVPLVADMSSNILSQVYDVNDFGVLFAGAQKNIGPAGFALVVVRRDLLERPALGITPAILNWAKQDQAGSMLNTPSTYPIYLAKLCFEWLTRQGGVAAIEHVNREKAALLYDCLDNSRLFRGTAERECRSLMNVTFVTGDAETDAAFVKGAAARGLVNLKGHRLVGGIRASIYNAMPLEGVRALVDYMKEFEAHV